GGLPRLRRRHDQRPLTLTDRHDQIDDPGGEDVRLGLQAQPLLRVERGELVELRAPAGLLRVHPVDGVQADQRVVLVAPVLTLPGGPHRAGHRVAPAQPVLADLRHRDVHVLGAGQVAVGADEGVVVQHVDDPGPRHQHVVLVDLRLAVAAPLAAAATPVPVAVAPATPAAAGVVVIISPVPAVAALATPGRAALLGLARGTPLVTAAPGGALIVAALTLLLPPGLRRPGRAAGPAGCALLGRTLRSCRRVARRRRCLSGGPGGATATAGGTRVGGRSGLGDRGPGLDGRSSPGPGFRCGPGLSGRPGPRGRPGPPRPPRAT